MDKNNPLSREALFAPHITRRLETAVREVGEVIELLDATDRSEQAGRLHALRVQLRELAADTQPEERAQDPAVASRLN